MVWWTSGKLNQKHRAAHPRGHHGIATISAKNPDAVAKFITATRNGLQYGSKKQAEFVAEILQKSANMNATDALAYANQWDGAYIASFEPQDIASLKRMYDIVKAVGGATKDAPDSAFDPGPYTRRSR